MSKRPGRRKTEPASSPAPLVFPRELDDESPLREALSANSEDIAKTAFVLRNAGWRIRWRVLDEQAVVLHWFACLALEHGPRWREVAAAELRAIAERT